MAGISSAVWFDLAYLTLTLTFVVLWLRHRRMPLPVVPVRWLGKGQLLYLGAAWTAVVFNFERELVVFQSQRLVTEGVLYLVALACTLVLLFAAGQDNGPAAELPGATAMGRQSLLRTTMAIGVLAAALSIVADWGVVRAIYGDRFAGHAALHIRFGPRATIDQLRNR